MPVDLAATASSDRTDSMTLAVLDPPPPGWSESQQTRLVAVAVSPVEHSRRPRSAHQFLARHVRDQQWEHQRDSLGHDLLSVMKELQLPVAASPGHRLEHLPPARRCPEHWSWQPHCRPPAVDLLPASAWLLRFSAQVRELPAADSEPELVPTHLALALRRLRWTHSVVAALACPPALLVRQTNRAMR